MVVYIPLDMTIFANTLFTEYKPHPLLIEDIICIYGGQSHEHFIGLS